MEEPNSLAGESAGQVKEKSKPNMTALSVPANLITFFVGTNGENKPFKIHKELIGYHSSVLFEALNKQPHIETMILNGVPVILFASLQHWLYTKEVLVYEKSKDDDVRLSSLQTLGRLWLLAQTFKMSRFQDNILTLLHYRIKQETNVACRFWAWLYSFPETPEILMMRILVTFRLFACWYDVDLALRDLVEPISASHIAHRAHLLLVLDHDEGFDQRMSRMAFRVIRQECGNVLSLM